MRVSIWLLGYGACSITAGVGLMALFFRLEGKPQWIVGVLGLYMLVSGIAIALHHRLSPLLFLVTGLSLLVLSLFAIFSEGYGRSQLFGLLGSLITVHGYWVLKQELERK